jgi:NTE family protein
MNEAPILGLALGSGGARGLAHAGVLQALDETGLQPQVIAGTSMGALVGGLYAETVDAAETWRRLAIFAEDEEFQETWAPFIPKGSGPEEAHGRLADLIDAVHKKVLAVKTVTRPSLVDAQRLRRPLETLFTARDFSGLQLPFVALGVDLQHGTRVAFREGDLLDAVYASAAIPGVFPPLQRGASQIVDGGAPFRVPIDACRELGATLVIAVDIPAFDSEVKQYRTGLEMMLRTDAIARLRLNELQLAQADLVISPDVSDYHWADFRCAEDCREQGYLAGRAAIPELRRMLAEPASLWSRLKRRLAG